MNLGENNDTPAMVAGAAGTGVFLLGVLFGSRFLKLVGLVAAVAGAVKVVRSKLAARDDRIDDAKESIRSTLDDLDPLARTEILADLVHGDPSGAES